MEFTILKNTKISRKNRKFKDKYKRAEINN